AAPQRRWEEEGDLRLAELEAAGVAGQRPGEEHHGQDDERDDVDAQIARHAGAEEGPGAVVAEEDPAEIDEAEKRADGVARIAHAPHARDDAVLERAEGDLDERARHDAFVSVILRKASSRLPSPRPICHFRSSIVPYAARLPWWMISTVSQSSSTR